MVLETLLHRYHQWVTVFISFGRKDIRDVKGRLNWVPPRIQFTMGEEVAENFPFLDIAVLKTSTVCKVLSCIPDQPITVTTYSTIHIIPELQGGDRIGHWLLPAGLKDLLGGLSGG